MTFSDFSLCAPLMRAIKDAGYTQPTPIQEQAIPVVLTGADVFGCAQTGTGKTAAFALPILSQVFDMGKVRGGPFALIVAPTRELAVQIGDSFRSYGKYMQFRHVTLYGGVSLRPQIEAVRRGVDVVIATPGRLLDLVDQGVLRLNNVQTLVLDEADRMLDMGFQPDIKRIVSLVPENRQTLFFSATLPNEIKKLANSMLHNPVNISVAPVKSASQVVEQQLYMVQTENKRALLNHLLLEELEGSVLVFTRTKRGADRVAKELHKNGHRVTAIHGDKSQHARQRALDDFKSRKMRVLVATDVAARGIDVTDLPFVVNFDMPDTAETYVHRIGRTGRAGKSGTALTLATHSDRGVLRDIERLINRKIDRIDNHPFSGHKRS
ncbi:MAG: DEAD/DEAH box helicase [Ignavibacteria bacterium]|nr:DEAD/DEAH box helicase [Ignavibacteria bacterium]